MEIRQLISQFDFLKILSVESDQCINYLVNFKNPKSYNFIKTITEQVFSFPTLGSNAYLGNFISFTEPNKIYKKYRLQLCDMHSLNKEDISLRVEKLNKAVLENATKK